MRAGFVDDHVSFSFHAAAGATGKKYNSAFQVQTPKRTYFMITESLEDLALWQRVRSVCSSILSPPLGLGAARW